MVDHENFAEYLPPRNVNALSIPRDRSLLVAYKVYKPSPEVRKLKSERKRTIFAEAFIENRNLGTLADLSVRAMTQLHDNNHFALISESPLMLREYYDSLSVELPLEQCHTITDEAYWRRVALAKTKDKALCIKSNINWKNMAISMKFVELVEACPAEYWPIEEMTKLAVLIKEFVTDVHIRKLQPLQDHAFEQFFESESDESSTSSDYEEDSEESASRALMGNSEESAGGEDEQNPDWQMARQRAKEKAAQKAAMAAIKAGKLQRLEERQRAREERQERHRRLYRIKKPPSPPPVSYTKSGKPKKPPKPKGIFDMYIPPNEDAEDQHARVADRRNMALQLHQMKKYNYPPEDCHHIDLSFLRFFDQLVSFTIEFLPPEVGRNFHMRYLNFSYVDIQNLADGIRNLPNLKTFRLSNSRMDTKKLEILVGSLKHLPALEVIDFRQDMLLDDCGDSLRELLQASTGLKELEFGGNGFSTNVMRNLADAILTYPGRIHYLGLARNPLGDLGLHMIINALLRTKQVVRLNLCGITVTENALICCIAHELLAQHEPLEELELIGVPFTAKAATELIIALDGNKTVREVNCQGCDLDWDIEFDIEVLLKRNKYLLDNPYIGDQTKTEQDIMDCVSSTKNPIMLSALEELKKKDICLLEGSQELNFQSMASLFRRDKRNDEEIKSVLEYQLQVESQREIRGMKHPSVYTFGRSLYTGKPFVYDASDFNEAEFKSHVNLPGPSDRFCYFLDRKRRENKLIWK